MQLMLRNINTNLTRFCRLRSTLRCFYRLRSTLRCFCSLRSTLSCFCSFRSTLTVRKFRGIAILVNFRESLFSQGLLKLTIRESLFSRNTSIGVIFCNFFFVLVRKTGQNEISLSSTVYSK